MCKIILTLILLGFPLCSLATDLPSFPFVVAVGSAEAEVKPDEATIELRVMAFDKSSSVALELANKAADSVAKLANEYGVDQSNIEATDFEKSTTRKRGDNYNRLEILGYSIGRSMTIRLISLKRYSEFMSDLVSIQNVSRVNSKFGVSNRKSIEEDLLNEASKDAKKQATLMAESLDTKLVSLYAASKASNFSRFFATFGAMSEISTEYDVGGGPQTL